jgi:hypothetical protein
MCNLFVQIYNENTNTKSPTKKIKIPEEGNFEQSVVDCLTIIS